MTPYALDWVNLVFRWFHFVAGISWIGTSLYFVWLDNHLTAPRLMPRMMFFWSRKTTTSIGRSWIVAAAPTSPQRME